MKNSFIDLLRQPDSILFQYEDSDIRFEEPVSREEQSSKIDYIVENGAGKVILYPSDRLVKRVKLRWRGDMSDVLMVMGDDYDLRQSSKLLGRTVRQEIIYQLYRYMTASIQIIVNYLIKSYIKRIGNADQCRKT